MVTFLSRDVISHATLQEILGVRIAAIFVIRIQSVWSVFSTFFQVFWLPICTQFSVIFSLCQVILVHVTCFYFEGLFEEVHSCIFSPLFFKLVIQYSVFDVELCCWSRQMQIYTCLFCVMIDNNYFLYSLLFPFSNAYHLLSTS